MSDIVSIALMICVTIILAILMIRNSINRLSSTKNSDFSFLVRGWGMEFGLYGGKHKPVKSELKVKANPTTDEPKKELPAD